jgi:thioredoxin 1
VQALNATNFQLKTSHGNVVVKFTAPWCQPCKLVQPLLEGAEVAYKNKVTFYTCDVDASNLGQLYGVQGIPTVIMFKGGVPVARIVGAFDKRKLDLELSKTYGC